MKAKIIISIIFLIIITAVSGCLKYVDDQLFEIRRSSLENHRTSKIKRIRKSGFRARMKSGKGRKLVNRRRRAGRSVNTV